MKETRQETCPDCLEQRDREWITKSIFKGVTVPEGFQVEKTWSSGTRSIAAPTRWATLCGCDAA